VSKAQSPLLQSLAPLSNAVTDHCLACQEQEGVIASDSVVDVVLEDCQARALRFTCPNMTRLSMRRSKVSSFTLQNCSNLRSLDLQCESAALLFMYTSVSLFLFVCLSACLLLCESVCPSLCLSVCPSCQVQCANCYKEKQAVFTVLLTCTTETNTDTLSKVALVTCHDCADVTHGVLIRSMACCHDTCTFTVMHVSGIYRSQTCLECLS